MIAAGPRGNMMLQRGRSLAPCTAARALTVFGGLRHASQQHLTAPRSCQSAAAAAGAKNHTEFTLSVEDKLDIMELCHRFDTTLNSGQQERLARFFAPDATVKVIMQDKAVREVRGVQHILDYFLSVRGLAHGNRHLTCNVVVEPDGRNAARVTAYRLLHKATNPPVLLAGGLIEDQLASVNGEWRFVVRNFIMDPPAEGQQQQQPQQGQQQQQQEQQQQQRQPPPEQQAQQQASA